jgi:hypothetical protein
VRSFGKPEVPASGARVKLIRTARTSEGREETRLVVNESVILTASNDGVRLAEYADEVEQLEAVAARLARSLSVSVEFTRVGPRLPGDENGVAMRTVPQNRGALDELEDDLPLEDVEQRRERLDRNSTSY